MNARSKTLPSTDLLRGILAAQLSDLEQVVAAAKRQLAASQEENRSLVRERSDLGEALLQLELMRVKCEAAETRWRTAVLDRQRSEEARRTLERQNAELVATNLELQAALERERQSSMVEIDCLEQQIEQLKAIVEVLLRGRTGSS